MGVFFGIWTEIYNELLVVCSSYCIEAIYPDSGLLTHVMTCEKLQLGGQNSDEDKKSELGSRRVKSRISDRDKKADERRYF